MHHYVIVRRDLPVGVLAAQVVHAAGESSPGNLPEGTCAVVLAVPGEAGLLELEGRLEAAGAPLVAIRETHGAYAGQLMAIGLRPGEKRTVGRCLSHLPLLVHSGSKGGSP